MRKSCGNHPYIHNTECITTVMISGKKISKEYIHQFTYENFRNKKVWISDTFCKLVEKEKELLTQNSAT